MSLSSPLHVKYELTNRILHYSIHIFLKLTTKSIHIVETVITTLFTRIKPTFCPASNHSINMMFLFGKKSS